MHAPSNKSNSNVIIHMQYSYLFTFGNCVHNITSTLIMKISRFYFILKKAIIKFKRRILLRLQRRTQKNSDDTSHFFRFKNETKEKNIENKKKVLSL